MKMEFRVYQLTYSNDLTEGANELFRYLRSMSIVPGEHGFEYCITNEIDLDENIITFCFSEEHQSDTITIDDEKNSFIADVAPFINTMVAIDLQEKRMIVQNRDYPANNLNKHQTMTRMRVMLNEAFENVYNSVFNTLDIEREINDEELEHAFYNNRVSFLRMQISNANRNLLQHVEIFEDRLLNEKWVEGWNTDQSVTYEVILKAPGQGGEGDLRLSPIAISLLNVLGARIEQINIWDEEGNNEVLSRSSFSRFIIRGINHRTQVITCIDTISQEVYNRRQELRSFRATVEL
ncbi:hypothetical protein JOC78_000801 [Bacillus ectoiniformans]|uniref:hypothetical protein n=1 Tax=Bacillus ectoiniformans TaxID=1494429 RepID=UPI001EF8FD3D|nr:hypothetical protein [Bacillus ectoiniformans]MBM7647861.1 hypothetical protein [Bacillus ectoiniformans]